jgi:hypothetical protein
MVTLFESQAKIQNCQLAETRLAELMLKGEVTLFQSQSREQKR